MLPYYKPFPSFAVDVIELDQDAVTDGVIFAHVVNIAWCKS